MGSRSNPQDATSGLIAMQGGRKRGTSCLCQPHVARRFPTEWYVSPTPFGGLAALRVVPEAKLFAARPAIRRFAVIYLTRDTLPVIA